MSAMYKTYLELASKQEGQKVWQSKRQSPHQSQSKDRAENQTEDKTKTKTTKPLGMNTTKDINNL